MVIGIAIGFSSCGMQRKSALIDTSTNILEEQMTAMAGTGRQLNVEKNNEIGLLDEQKTMNVNKFDEAKIAESNTNTLVAVKTVKKAHSFTEMKEMVKNGEIKMGARDFKTLKKLDKLYKGDFNKLRTDAFEMTGTAKIIAGVGVASALIAIFVGSWFFAFLFLLAVLAFLLRWIGIIDF